MTVNSTERQRLMKAVSTVMGDWSLGALSQDTAGPLSPSE